MKLPIAVVLAVAFTAGMVIVPMSAEANCTQVIYAERALSNGTTAQILGRNISIDAFQWFGETTNNQFASLIFSAVSQRNRVTVTGNAQSCPTTPTNGARSLGTILFMAISP